MKRHIESLGPGESIEIAFILCSVCDKPVDDQMPEYEIMKGQDRPTCNTCVGQGKGKDPLVDDLPFRRCENCEWWVKNTHVMYPEQGDQEPYHIAGECHRFPKMELTNENDWCGEFQAKERDESDEPEPEPSYCKHGIREGNWCPRCEMDEQAKTLKHMAKEMKNENR